MNNVINIGQIGIGENPYTAADFEAQLSQADESQPLVLDIHSEGGSVWEGFRMFQLATAWPGKIVGKVQCAAFSIASYLLMACDEIEIADNGWVMIHNPYAAAEGDATELTKNANLLADLRESMIVAYSERTGISADEVGELMDAESYLGAKQAIEMGFADRTIDHAQAPRTLQPQASAKRSNSLPVAVMASLYGRPPGNETPAIKPQEDTVSTTTPVAATVALIEKTYPKASEKFIVKCMRDEMSMDDVGKDYARAMDEDNTSLKDQLAKAMNENAELKAQLGMTQGMDDMDPNAMDYDMDPNAMQDPNAYHNPGEMHGGGAQARSRVNPRAGAVRAPGLAPVAGVGGAAPTKDPTEEFNALVEGFKAKGFSGSKALIMANAKAPKLRMAHIEQVNANRSRG